MLFKTRSEVPHWTELEFKDVPADVVKKHVHEEKGIQCFSLWSFP